MDYLLNGLPYFPGTTIFGTGLFADGTAAAPSISFASDTDTGIYRFGANVLGFSTGGIALWSLYSSGGSNFLQSTGTNGLYAKPAGEVGLFAGGSAQNITLAPTTTGWVQMGGTVDGQLRLYSSSNVEQMRLRVDGNPSFIATGSVLFGTGTDSSNGRIQLATHTTSVGGIGFGTDTFLYRYAPGGLVFGSAQTNTLFSLSNSSGNTGQVGFLGNNLQLLADVGSIILKSGNATALTLDASQNATFVGDVSTANAKAFYWGTRSVMTSPSDGVIRLTNSAGSGFNRIQLGGTSSSFPALASSGATVQVVLADYSNFATLDAANYIANSAAATVIAGKISYGSTTATTVGAAGGASLLPATPLGYIIVNVAGTAAKIPYYNS